MRCHPLNKIPNFNEDNEPFESSSIKCYAYHSDLPIIWNQKFRDHLVKSYQIGSLVPVKCGEKKKHTSSGVFQTPQNITDCEQMKFGRATIHFVSISEQRFVEVKQTSKNKIFFKGFPLQASKSDVESLFGKYGSIQYVYFMCSPKSGRTTSKMGYLIYENRDSVNHLLSLKHLVFGQSVITFQEYQSKRNKSDSSENIEWIKPHLHDHPRSDDQLTLNNKTELDEAVERSALFERCDSKRQPILPPLQADRRQPAKRSAIEFHESLHNLSSKKCRIKTRIEDDSVGSLASSSKSLSFHFNNKRILTKEYLIRSQEVIKNTQDASNLRFNIIKSH